MTPQERFEALFERTHIALLGYALRRVTVPEDAVDVVAETYLVAWRRIDDVPSGEQARPWLFGVARNVLANHRRGERRRLALAQRLQENVRQVLPAPEFREITTVERALALLGEDDREVLRLLAWEELDRAEIAVAMGLSQALVRVRLHRARTRLRRQLARVEEADSIRVQRNSIVGQVSEERVTTRSVTRES